MSIAIITGSAGLIGSEASRYFAAKGMQVIGIDNDMRSVFFGEEASTAYMSDHLSNSLKGYLHHSADIRDRDAIFALFREYGTEIDIVIHTAAQPSHDWAAREPFTDFSVNAVGTLTMLEATRLYCPEAVFIFTSTNKVYGDTPNSLPLRELDTRWEIDSSHAYAMGIDEKMSIDRSMHSIFGASKVSADILVQEYGRYFDIKTVCFRGGCLTGPAHSGTQLHGFLAYLMKCCATETPYLVFGYKGKQVRDNIHSFDLIQAFNAFYEAPRFGEVYNIGGGRFSNCSMLEGMTLCEEITGKDLQWTYKEGNRMGDHMWWIGDLSKFKSHFPAWQPQYNIEAILRESYEANVERWTAKKKEMVQRQFSYVKEAFGEEIASKRLFTACIWHFRAWSSSRPLDQLLESTIAMEVILGDRDTSEGIGLNKLIGNRCAYMLGKTATERDQIQADFRKLYKLRSSIVHIGKHRADAEDAKVVGEAVKLSGRIIRHELKSLADSRKAI